MLALLAVAGVSVASWRILYTVKQCGDAAEKAGDVVQRVANDVDEVKALAQQGLPAFQRALNKVDRVCDAANIMLRMLTFMISLFTYKIFLDLIDLISQQSFQGIIFLCVFYFLNLMSWVCLFLTGFFATQCVNELFRYRNMEDESSRQKNSNGSKSYYLKSRTFRAR